MWLLAEFNSCLAVGPRASATFAPDVYSFCLRLEHVPLKDNGLYRPPARQGLYHWAIPCSLPSTFAFTLKERSEKLALSSSWEPIFTFSENLEVDWHHIGSMKLAEVKLFTSMRLVNSAIKALDTIKELFVKYLPTALVSSNFRLHTI